MLSRLVAVKHAMPEVDPGLPAAEWRLGEDGREGARALAEHLKGYGVVAVASSVEPKAWETAAILAQRLAVPCAALEGLHEHERRSVGYGPREQFVDSIRALFDRPDELVYGDETGRQAQCRFADALERAIEHWGPLAEGEGRDALVVVAHGTVISLLCAAWCGVEPFPLWDSLGLPSYVVISLPDRRLVERPHVAPESAESAS